MAFRDDFQQLDEIDKLFSQAKPFTEAEKEKLVKAGKWEAVSAKKSANLKKAKAAAKALLEASVNTDKYPYIQQILANIEHNQQIQTRIELKQSGDEDERYQQLLPYCQLAYLEEKNGLSEDHAKKLSLIFNDTADALIYLKDNMKQNKLVVHDACLFQLPDMNQCDFATWKKLIKANINDNEFRMLLPNAPDIESALKQHAGKKIDDVARKKIQVKKEELEKVNRDLKTAKRHHDNLSDEEEERYERNIARLSELKLELYELSHGLPLKDADKWILSACQEYNIINSSAAYAYMQRHGLTKNDCIKFFELHRQNNDEIIPPMTIEGSDYGFPGCYLMKVDVMDELQAARAACFGKLTKCCQSLSGEAGEPCTIHGLTSPNGGFYVVIHGDKNNPRIKADDKGEEDIVLGQCWVWRGNDDAIVFDSIEVSGEAATEPVKVLFNALAQEIVKKNKENKPNRESTPDNKKKLNRESTPDKDNKPYATRVLCGARSGISSMFGTQVLAAHIASPIDYNDYRDSYFQNVIVDPARPYYFADREGPKATEEMLKTLLSKKDIQTNELVHILNYVVLKPQLNLMDQFNSKGLAFSDKKKKMDIIANMVKIVTDWNNEAALEYKQQESFRIKQLLDRILIYPCMANIQDARRYTPLMKAVQYGYSEIVNKLIQAKADINARSIYGGAAIIFAFNMLIQAKADINAEKGEAELHYSMMKNQNAIIEQLLKAGANVDEKDYQGWTALIYATTYNQASTVEMLIKKKANPNKKGNSGDSALHYAAVNGFTDIADMLIKAGADIDAKNNCGVTPLFQAVLRKNVPVVELLIKAKTNLDLKDSRGYTALDMAVTYNEHELMRALINAGAKISDNAEMKGKMLHLASMHGYIDIIEKLIIAKADINQRDEHRNTALINAVRNGYTAIVGKLIQANADVDGKNSYKETALMDAAINGQTEIVKMLIDAKADMNSVSTEGRTALMKAAANGQTAVVKMLIDAKADLDLQDKLGRTAIDFGRAHPAVIEILKKAGAPVSIAPMEKKTAVEGTKFGFTDMLTKFESATKSSKPIGPFAGVPSKAKKQK